MGAEGLGNAGSEPVGLNQHGGELLYFENAGSFGEAAHRIGAPFPRPGLETDHRKLLADVRIRESQLARDMQDRLIEAESGFDADRQKVERVRKGPFDSAAAPLNPLLQQLAR